MSGSLRKALLPAVLFAFVAHPTTDPGDMRGYSADAARVQRDWETKFKAIPDPGRMREAMRRLAARPHHLGSPYGKLNAEWIRDQLKSYGWDASIEEFSVLFPTPKDRLVELVSPTKFTARLDEPVLKEDPTSGQKSEQLPTYLAYSADGDVTGPLVYVNYGVPADYEELEKRGVSVKGAIVIARYGGSWRGIKPKVAAEHGAIGCLIYSDPKDDGYAQGEVYPAGPFRPKDGVQRGSILDMPNYPGDPLTPGVGATANAKRLELKDAATLMKIPALPLSYADAQPLLAAMTGRVAPESWRGALPITYRIGPGPATVHLKVSFDWSRKPAYDVIGKIPGSTYPDQWVVRGNHHDGWVNGAEDPISGAVPELEEARAIGELLKQGWKPKRTLIYAFWDGEEPALLGSTEWAETHAEELRQKAVLYLNSDGNGRGYLNAGGSHTLERFVNQVAREIDDPESKLTVWKRLQAGTIARGNSKQQAEARSRPDFRLDALGSGSDFTPFLQHVGVPTLDVSYGGEDGGGIYHSIYDDFRWYTAFSDTSFAYGRTMAQTNGTLMIRMANAELLPYEFGALAETVKNYIGELKELRDTRAAKIEETNRQISDGIFAAVDDPRNPLVAPKPEAPAPVLNFAPLDNAGLALTKAAERYEKAYGAAVGSPNQSRLERANAILQKGDQPLLAQEGLPRRPWYRHLLYAPGLYTGYGVKTVPGVREAIEQSTWADADTEIVRVAAALGRQTDLINRAAAALEQP